MKSFQLIGLIERAQQMKNSDATLQEPEEKEIYNTLELSVSFPFFDKMNLQNAVFKSFQDVNLEKDTSTSTLISMLISILASSDVQKHLIQLLYRCRYNGECITKDLIESKTSFYEDFHEIAFIVIKEEILPALIKKKNILKFINKGSAYLTK